MVIKIIMSSQPPGRHICDSTVQRIVTNNCKRVLGKHVYPHLIRDIVAFWYLTETQDFLTVAKLLGHKDIRVTINLYGHYAAKEAAQMYDELWKKKFKKKK